MIKSLIVKAIVLPAVGGGAFLAGHGDIPGLPTDNAPPAAAAAPAPAPAAPSSVGGFQVIATCDDPQQDTRAGQAPSQARKAEARTVTVQVPQAAAPVTAAPAGQEAETSTAPTTAPAAPPAADASGKVNLNTATDAELDKVPGIGAATIAQIHEHRPNIKSVDELAQWPGITGPNFAKFKDRVTV